MARRSLAASLATIAAYWTAAALATPPIQQHDCQNGLTVLVVENHAVPLVTVEIAVKSGSMTEGPRFNGLSHLYEHMFFKANQVIPNQSAYLTRARELGLVRNATTDNERVNYFFTTTTKHFSDAMAFMRDAIVSPLFDQQELVAEREVVAREIEERLATPNYQFHEALQRRVFWKYPTYKLPMGSAAVVKAATRDQLKTIQSRYYVPNNSVLVVTGDVQAQEVFTQTDALYSTWAKAPDPFVKYPLVKHPPIAKSEVLVVEQVVGNVQAQFVWHGPSTRGDDIELTYAADLMNTALQGTASRFHQKLIQSGLCLWADFGWVSLANTGPVRLGLTATADRADACIRAALDELPKIREPGYLSPTDLANGAFRYEIQRIRANETSAGLAHELSFWWAIAGLDYYVGYIDHLKHATEQQIVTFLDKYVLGRPYVFGVMVSPEMARNGLTQSHFEELVGLKSKSTITSDASKASSNRQSNSSAPQGGSR